MTTETKILTDEQIMVTLVRLYETHKSQEMGELRAAADLVPIGRAIEQAVLQSPEVRAWKKDAERYRAWRQGAVDQNKAFLDAAYKYQDEHFHDGPKTTEQFDAGLDYAINAAAMEVKE